MPTEIGTTFGYIRNLSDWVDILCHILNPDRNSIAYYYASTNEKVDYFTQFMWQTAEWLNQYYPDFQAELTKAWSKYLYEFITDDIAREMFGVFAIIASPYLE